MKKWKIAITVLSVALGFPRAGWAASVELAPADHPVLIAVREGPGEQSYTLICQGLFHHRLVQEGDGLQVIVELPGVENGISPDGLPEPNGLVKHIEVQEEDGQDLIRVLFQFHRPAIALARTNDQGLQLRLDPVPGNLSLLEPDERPLGREDLLEITVFEIPELTRTTRVSEKGRISLPLLGEVQAAGLTPRELEERLRERLKEKYLQDPQVSVFVREHGSKMVSVLGEVGEPGVYEMFGPRTLLQVLSQAGGLTSDVAIELFVIRTTASGASERIAVNIETLLENRAPEINLPILPGDVISVPVDRIVTIFVDGAVGKPGGVEGKESRPISLLQAIARVGGTTERANLKAVQILRKRSGDSQTLLTVNLKRIRKGKDPDPILRDGDIVVVPETFF